MTIPMIILITLAMIYIGFILILLTGFMRLVKAPLNLTSSTPMVSILVPVRNGESTLTECLESLLAQTYPKDHYEILIINDHSTDYTSKIIQKYNKEHTQITGIDNPTLKPNYSPKKQTIETGIKHARGDLILTTDADCIVPPEWINQMTSTFDEQIALSASWLVVDPGKTILGRLESLDSLAFVLIGAASFGLGKPFLANAANMAYRKNVFLNINGFEGNAHMGSGDDDLLLQKITKSKTWTTIFNASPQNIVYTKANSSFSAFIKQRIRWASKTSQYTLPLLTLEFFVLFFYVVTLLSILFSLTGIWPLYPLLLFVIKFLLDFLFMSTGCRHLKKSLKIKDLFLAELLQLVYVPIVAISGLNGSYQWKGRQYKKGSLKH